MVNSGGITLTTEIRDSNIQENLTNFSIIPGSKLALTLNAQEFRKTHNTPRRILHTPAQDLKKYHREARQNLVDLVKETSGFELDPDLPTIGIGQGPIDSEYAQHLRYIINTIVQKNEVHFGKFKEGISGMHIIIAGSVQPIDFEAEKRLQMLRNYATATKYLNIRYVPLDTSNASILASGVDAWLVLAPPPKNGHSSMGTLAMRHGVPLWTTYSGVHDGTLLGKFMIGDLEEKLLDNAPEYLKNNQQRARLQNLASSYDVVLRAINHTDEYATKMREALLATLHLTKAQKKPLAQEEQPTGPQIYKQTG